MNFTQMHHRESSWDFRDALQSARSGDPAASDQLFQHYYPVVERMVHLSLSRDLRLQRPWLTARFSTGDMVQEVFRSLLRDLGGFEGRTEEAFKGYLAMVIRNRLIDAIRFHEAAQRDGRRTHTANEAIQVISEQRSPVAGAQSVEELEAVHAVLASFPERERLLLRGRLEQDLKFTELAEQLGYASKWAARRSFYAAQAQLAILLRLRMSDRTDLPPHSK